MNLLCISVCLFICLWVWFLFTNLSIYESFIFICLSTYRSVDLISGNLSVYSWIFYIYLFVFSSVVYLSVCLFNRLSLSNSGLGSNKSWKRDIKRTWLCKVIPLFRLLPIFFRNKKLFWPDRSNPKVQFLS